MEFLVGFAEKHGVQALGWAIALLLAWKFFSKWDGNIIKLTDNVTELTTIVKVQQERMDNMESDRREDREALKNLQEVVFRVKYK